LKSAAHSDDDILFFGGILVVMKHRHLTLVALYLMVGVGVATIYYLGSGQRNIALAAAVGTAAGLVTAVLESSWRAAPDEARERALDRFPYFPTLIAASGVALLVAGLVLDSWGIAASGALFLAIAAGFLMIRYALRHVRR
jgi:hypothetical protein